MAAPAPPSPSPSPSQKSQDIMATETTSVETTEEWKQQKLHGLQLFVLFACMTLVTFLALLDTSILGTAIPKITSEFHSLPDVGWYVGAMSLASATLQPLTGKIYTHFHSKAVFLVFVFVFELGSLICGVAPNSAALIVGRAIAGLGLSGIVNGALTIITASVEKEKSPLYTGIWFGVSQMGVVAGPLIGGALTQHASWRWCFYINLPIGGAAAGLFVIITVPEHIKKEPFSMALVRKVIPELDLIGFSLFAPPAVMFLLALQFGSGNSFAWNSATVIGLFVGAAVLSIIFILWERHMGDRAMIPGSLLRQRRVWTSCLFAVANVGVMNTASNFMPTYFQAVRGDSPTMSGVHVLPSILSQLLCVILAGGLMGKLGYYLPWAFGSGIITAIGNGLISTFSPTTTVAQFIGYQIITGAGRGLGMQAGLIAIQNATTPALVPVAMAMMIFTQNFAISVIVVLSNTIFAQTLTNVLPQYAPSVSAQAALEAGSDAGAVRHLVNGHEAELNGVLLAFSESLRNIFYFLVGISAVGVVVSLGMGWVDVRKKAEPKTSEDVEVQNEKVADEQAEKPSQS